jgi:hypothetical protein
MTQKSKVSATKASKSFKVKNKSKKLLSQRHPLFMFGPNVSKDN